MGDIHEKLVDVNLENFISIDNGVLPSEILNTDDIIENHAAGNEDRDGLDKSPPTQEPPAVLRVQYKRQFISASPY